MPDESPTLRNVPLEERLRILENMFVRLEGKIDLVNHQIESGQALFLERFGDAEAGMKVNQEQIGRLRDRVDAIRETVPNQAEQRIRSLEDWRTELKAVSRAGATAIGTLSAVGGGIIAVLIDHLLAKGH